MATVLQVHFPGRSYHATPWGHHVNEGQVEWPPAPWRILRALLATGFMKLGWAPDGPPDVARRLVERLAALTPSYALPAISLAHSRHYVDADGKKPLIIDAFAHVDDGIIEIIWDTELLEEERSVLAELAGLLGYLGRAESWVAAVLTDRSEARINCAPAADGMPRPGFDLVRVRCAIAAGAYAAWRAERAAAVEAAGSPTTGKSRTTAQQKKLDAALRPYPRDLIAALCTETSTLQEYGWSAAPGSREVIYTRSADALAMGLPPGRRAAEVSSVPMALLSLSTASRGTSALPPLRRAYAQGRLMHQALGSVIGRQMGGDAALARCLLGQEDGAKVGGNHGHAHFLPLDLDDDQRLDHVMVYAPMGLKARAQEALLRLRRTYMKHGAGELQIALAGLGDAETLRTIGGRLGAVLGKVLGPNGGATTWVSATPYVAPRLLKRRGKDSLEGLVRGECQRRNLPAPVEVVQLDRQEAEERVRSLRHYILHDERHEPPWRMPFALRLRFSEPVPGPICLGYGAHAGLGRFEAEG